MGPPGGEMKRVLIVKVTSLGDIVHGLPIVADLQRAYPGVAVDWAADAAFADLLRWHAGISRVLCAPLRSFKKQRRLVDLRAIAGSIGELRRFEYDAAIDIHGVYKSAIISYLSRAGSRYGYRSADLGERGAAFAYTRRFARQDGLNAWDGLRKSVSDAFGYSLVGEPRFDLQVPRPDTTPEIAERGPFAMLLHAGSSEAKRWPVARWHAIGQYLLERGIACALPWGSEDEHANAVAIANGIPGAVVLPRLSLERVAQHIDLSTLVVGVDTGFVHLASALRKPTVMIFTATSKALFGIDVPGRSLSVGDEGRPPEIHEVRDAIEQVCPAVAQSNAPLIETPTYGLHANASAQRSVHRHSGTMHTGTS
jgi:heptosyltransferase I